MILLLRAPGWPAVKRALVVASLVVFTAYHAVCFYRAFFGAMPFERVTGNITWPSKWSMFTRYTGKNGRILFEAYRNGRWRRIPMERWYPMRWDTGYRWERAAVTHSGRLQRMFLDAACRRSSALRTRMVSVRWRRVFGQYDPRPHGRRRVLRVFRCGSPVDVPKGTLL